jgi:hypothetical protein
MYYLYEVFSLKGQSTIRALGRIKETGRSIEQNSLSAGLYPDSGHSKNVM